MSWPDFKKEIYNIYDHRVENSPEINGAINNTFLTLDEHLMLYQCEQGGENSHSRDENENRLMDFLYSLKYYCQRWPRAKMYARMLGFLRDEKLGVLAAKGSGQNTRQSAEVRLEENVTPTSEREKEELTHDSQGNAKPKHGIPVNYTVNRKMLEHNEELDGHISELGTPLTDIFL